MCFFLLREVHVQPKRKRQRANASDGWRDKHKEMWKGVAAAEKWSAKHDLRGVKTPRAVDVIDLAYAHQPHLPLFADLSQAGPRRPWAPHLRSMVAASCYYSFARDRIVLPREHLALLGFPASVKVDMPGMSDGKLRQLAGEGMGLPCIALISLCVLAQHKDLWSDATDT